MTSISNCWVRGFVVSAVAFVALAIAGAVRWFSSVPYWDMWEGYLGFFIKVSNGDMSQWWAQHNEHRILLSRILFWVDLQWLGGSGWMLIVAIFVFLALTAYLFWWWLRDATGADADRSTVLVLALFLVCCMFLWSQRENMTWGFQTQFVLAQLMPLAAFFWLQRSTNEGGSSARDFLVACGLGVASIGTMANGVVALPLMTAYALVARQRARRVITLAALSVATLAAYFYGYSPVPRHGSLLAALRSDPLGVGEFIALYLGSPVRYVFVRLPDAVAGGATGLAGLLLIAASVWFAVKTLREPRPSRVNLALLFFILYIGGTALGTAGGRLELGMSGAVSGRYTTPALMAWAALLVLAAPTILERVREHGNKALWPLVAVLIVMAPLQLDAMNTEPDMHFQRSVAALALDLGASDPSAIGAVFPNAGTALSIAKVAAARDLSVFGMPPLKGLAERIGAPASADAAAPCEGEIEGVQALGAGRFVRVRGWIFDETHDEVPEGVAIVDRQGTLVGYALSGEVRADIRDMVSPRAENAGFEGYVLSSAIGQPVTVVGGDSQCRFETVVPRLGSHPRP